MVNAHFRIARAGYGSRCVDSACPFGRGGQVWEEGNSLQITEGITAYIFHLINSLAVDAIGNGREQIMNEAVQSWEPEFNAEAPFA